MDTFIEQLAIYSIAIFLCLIVVFIYLRKQKRESKEVEEKIDKAKVEGLFEPVSLHPVVDEGICIKTGACIAACPEKDILGIRNGKATPINASHCIGHGACFHACPMEAITLCIGTEKRGVELPHVNQNFETNVPGIFIAGELGGMGLIKNAVEQGRQAVENIVKSISKNHEAEYDLIIIGAGPAGISASLNAKKHHLKFLTLEQDTMGGTVYTFPRSKIVMTSAMDVPLHGKIKLSETSKKELLDFWTSVLRKNTIAIQQSTKVEAIVPVNGHFRVETLTGEKFTSCSVLLSIGRRGTPRKLGIPGETLEKVAYRLLEPEEINGKDVMIVGGGDSAIESALLLAGRNRVTLSYRSDAFSRIKPKNNTKIKEAIASKSINVMFNSKPVRIEKESIILVTGNEQNEVEIRNDLIYIFAGGELPIEFLQKVGIQITKKFGEAILKH